MKEKIIIFIIGFLLGAILATGAFFIYTKNNPSNSITTTQSEQMPGGNPPEKPEGEKPEMNGQKPPEKPSNETNNSSKNNSSDTTESN